MENRPPKNLIPHTPNPESHGQVLYKQTWNRKLLNPYLQNPKPYLLIPDPCFVNPTQKMQNPEPQTPKL